MDAKELTPVKKARSSEEIMGDMIKGQAIMLARLQATVEQIPALRAELDALRAELALLRPVKE
jgi:hypothetical protein